MYKFLLVILLTVSTIASAYTVTYFGKSCQICTTKNDITVCKHYDKCPIKQEKK
jgi:hypothetical protein